MPEFRVTFGQKYPRQAHPTFAKAHRDGWLTIVADNYTAARACADARLGNEWSLIYEPGEQAAMTDYFPLGELHRIEVTEDE